MGLMPKVEVIRVERKKKMKYNSDEVESDELFIAYRIGDRKNVVTYPYHWVHSSSY